MKRFILLAVVGMAVLGCSPSPPTPTPIPIDEPMFSSEEIVLIWEDWLKNQETRDLLMAAVRKTSDESLVDSINAGKGKNTCYNVLKRSNFLEMDMEYLGGNVWGIVSRNKTSDGENKVWKIFEKSQMVKSENKSC